MKSIFTIGETAKIHHISKQTLIFYDKKGLLKPAYIDEENGYRYYSLEEFAALDVILFLKFLGLPLKEINSYLTERSAEKSIAVLKKQKQIVERNLFKLKAVRAKINSSLSVYEDYKDWADKKGPFIKKRKVQHALWLAIEPPYGDEQVDLSLKRLVLFVEQEDYLADYSMGSIIRQEDLLNGIFKYTKTFIIINKAVSNANYFKLQAGTYATIYHHGPYENISISYEKLLEFIHNKGYTIDGDAKEYLIFDVYVVKDKKDFVTEISIKVK
jgi:DNA-binding transcriptional MerR regulator/effector-binding domain-containing protein